MERMIAELFPCVNEGESGSTGFGSSTTAAGGAPLPSFEEFLKHICRRTRTPLTCMCLALLYLTRLRANHPRSRGSPGSSYRLALSSLCVATKYLYDDAYHTCSWVQVSMGLFNQREVNQMEMEFMYFLHYQLGVTPTEWNQWIATLEAKLVSRWQEKGKAEVIYGFGLFLSYECCEPTAQETVRDIAWGEGGKSLLAMLNNAIHLPGDDDLGKGSPSADSAVSDTTCLPTPDPNSWFRIRSPATAGARSSATSASAVAACSTSITPTTAQFADISSIGEDSTSAAVAGAAPSLQSHPSAYMYSQQYGGDPVCEPSPKVCRYATSSSNAGLSKQNGLLVASAHALRPSSVCSMPGVVPSASGHSYESGTYNSSRFVPSAPAHSQKACRYVSDSKGRDWRTQATSAQSMTFSPSHSLPMAPRDDTSAICHPNSVVIGGPKRHFLASSTSLASGGSVQNRPPYFGSDSRSLSNAGHGNCTVCTGGVSTDRKCAHSTSTLPRLSSVGAAAGPVMARGSIPAFGSSSTATAAIACRDYRSNGQQGPDSAVPTSKVSKDTQAKNTMRFGGSVAYSVHGDCTSSPHNAYSGSGGGSSNSIRYMGAGAGISNASCGVSAKSSVSSLKTASRRQSWRSGGRNAGTSFAQRLRSFAVFSWTSGGNNGGGSNDNSSSSSNNNNGTESIADIRLSAKPQLPTAADEQAVCATRRRQDTGYSYQNHSSYVSTATATMRAVSASSTSNASGGFGEAKQNGCCPSSQLSTSSGTCSAENQYQDHGHALSSGELGKRPNADSRGKRVPIANVRHALDGIASPSYDFELEMTKYVSTKS
ncbi:hypothetical protein LPJ81_001003 [Coemansia sp. IMI 209127]|nr:hypothetical protein LPJ81_001003 [Coemansia sp. IMI 209127]